MDDVRHVSAADLSRRYFAGRPDGLRLSRGEEFLVARSQAGARSSRGRSDLLTRGGLAL